MYDLYIYKANKGYYYYYYYYYYYNYSMTLIKYLSIYFTAIITNRVIDWGTTSKAPAKTQLYLDVETKSTSDEGMSNKFYCIMLDSAI